MALLVPVVVVAIAGLCVGLTGGLDAIRVGLASRPDGALSMLLTEDWVWMGWLRTTAAAGAAVGVVAGVVSAVGLAAAEGRPGASAGRLWQAR